MYSIHNSMQSYANILTFQNKNKHIKINTLSILLKKISFEVPVRLTVARAAHTMALCATMSRRLILSGLTAE